MPVIPNLGGLVAVPQAAMNYPARNVAGIDVVDLSGGLFVMGGPGFDNAPAHWTRVSPLAMGRRRVFSHGRQNRRCKDRLGPAV